MTYLWTGNPFKDFWYQKKINLIDEWMHLIPESGKYVRVYPEYDLTVRRLGMDIEVIRNSTEEAVLDYSTVGFHGIYNYYEPFVTDKKARVGILFVIHDIARKELSALRANPSLDWARQLPLPKPMTAQQLADKYRELK